MSNTTFALRNGDNTMVAHPAPRERKAPISPRYPALINFACPEWMEEAVRTAADELMLKPSDIWRTAMLAWLKATNRHRPTNGRHT
jgi:hypothetical protein